MERAPYPATPPDLREVVRYIKRNSSEDEMIYVGVANHDCFTTNHPAVYFLADRGYASRYHELHPGVTTTPDVQREIIAELETYAPRLVVLTPAYVHEPNDSSIDLRVDLLDGYISSNYERMETFGNYEIWVRLEV